MTDQRRFHPSEIDVELGPESAELLATARDLESYAATGMAAPTIGFEDRVMAAIADEPMPRRAGRGFLATVRDAWAIAFGPGRPVALRAQAFAMLLALAVAVGSVGSVAVVGAARLLGDQGPVPPTVPSPSPSPTPSPSIVSPSRSPSISPSPTPRPSGSPVETETAEPSGTDDDGGGGSGNSGPGRGGDDSGGSSGSGSSGSGSSGSSSTDDSRSGSEHD
ncbi:MAG TPA: hypothetical protein VK867_10300 [Candidatus Limnocylindrales bacterium]|nr:hypothetical protein [Candidatus Limnocylindrales bacterium]